jgi:hypothetical protein
MKKFVLAVIMYCFFGVGRVFADFVENKQSWKDVKRKITNVLQSVEKIIMEGLLDNARKRENFNDYFLIEVYKSYSSMGRDVR